MKWVVAIAAVAGVFALPARAANEVPLANPRAVVDVFSAAMIEAYFDEVGVVYERIPNNEGVMAYVAYPKGAEGARFVTIIHACKEPNQCYGLEYAAFFETPSKYATAEAMNRGNMSAPFVKIMLAEDGKTVLSRYVISDGGITRGNIFLNMMVFFGQASAIAEAFAEDGGRQVFVDPPTTSGLGAHGLAALPKGATRDVLGKVLKTHADWVNTPKTAKAWMNSRFAEPHQ